MSPSTRSKPASASSPASGPETEPEARPHGPVEIELEISRQRQIAWTIGGIIGGSLLIWKLGTVGVWVGYVLVALGLFRAYQLVMSFLYPPGKIVVTDREVILPRGLHRPKPLEVTPKDVTAVYFLRRSVPWNRSAPVLVIEIGDRAMAFPRDWFASEADQRHIVHALLARDTGRDDKARGDKASDKADKASDKADKASDKADKASDKADKASDKADKASDKAGDKASDKAGDKASDKAADKASDKAEPVAES